MPWNPVEPGLDPIEEARERLGSDRPFVLYRIPESNRIVGIFPEDGRTLEMDGSRTGFIVAPFQSGSGARLIPADLRGERPWQPAVEIPAHKAPFVAPETGRQKHVERVARALAEIQKGGLEKVVLARKIQLQSKRCPVDTFMRALDRYPEAFCYLLQHPVLGNWCGATPETLVAMDSGRMRSMALAGTRPFQEGRTPDWTEKEYREQGVVTDRIRERFEAHLSKVTVGPRTSIRAGRLWHLMTPIEGRFRNKEGIMDLLHALHPTPAVCGHPRARALAYILEHEGLERGLYSGYLGPWVGDVDSEPWAAVYVNLRCMEWEGDRRTLYVGGGITSGSDPEAEFEETRYKAGTLGALLD